MSEAPRIVWLPVAFFFASGVLEITTSILAAPHPLGFWPIWEALGRGGLHFLLALGLWRRVALSRAIAMIYCLATLVTYGIALGLLLTHAPLRFPSSVVVSCLFQVPSCALLFPYLGRPEAMLVFVRPLFD
jgi:hypothetical protein